MPLYMDRHDVSEAVTPEMIAHIHQQDLKIQDRYGCTVLTYWFDEKRNTAFCLIEAPNESAIYSLHNEAHGQVPNSIIEVSTDLVESFLGRIDDPEKAKDAELNLIDESAFRTIMIISLKQLTPARVLSEQLRAVVVQFNNAVPAIVKEHRGSLVKHTENCFLASFRLASDAVHTAFNVQLRFEDFKKSHEANLSLKIGLSTGVPVANNKSFFETTIRLAERMCQILKGEIIVSSDVKELYNSENLVGLKNGIKTFCLTAIDERFLTALMDYAETTWFNTDLNIDDFSRALGYSKSQLYRKMTSLTGKSPNSFINDYRLNEALNLLTNHSGNVSEIAFQTGFTSASYFSKCFKKKYGYSPYDFLSSNANQYRKNLSHE